MALFDRFRSKEQIDPYCYENTDILINLHGIKDDQILLETLIKERVHKRIKYDVRQFDMNYDGFKEIHDFLYNDSFEWAGLDRSDETVIQGNKFQPPQQFLDTNDFETEGSYNSEDVSQNAALVFRRFQSDLDAAKENQTLDGKKFAEECAYLSQSVNIIRPFRSGNDGAIKYYTLMAAEKYGFQLNVESEYDRWNQLLKEAQNDQSTDKLASFLSSRIKDRRTKDYSYDQLSADNALGNERISATFKERSEEKGLVQAVQPEEKQEQAKPEKPPANDEKEQKPYAPLFKDERIHNIADEIKAHIEEKGEYYSFYHEQAGQFADNNPDYSKEDAEKALWGVFAQRNDNQNMHEYMQNIKEKAEVRPKGATKDEDKKLTSILDKTENPKETRDNMKEVARLNVAAQNLSNIDNYKDGAEAQLSTRKANYLLAAIVVSQESLNAKIETLSIEDRDYIKGQIEQDVEQLQKEPDQQTQSLSNPYEFKESPKSPEPSQAYIQNKDQENEGR